ncbi:hypothetical protein ACHHYP_10388 [Achlya hypogyna]|uniref:FAR1 domain-containing protein n=1 Tax=Achlya hypogyna TaxID=1202772 RepID=A0A1V9YLK1_ACHHY|nr:hypothetical protein ACHHYP_10388 [Achlya hypogyna]
MDEGGSDAAPSWRLEKRKSKYAKARALLEQQFSATGIECPVRSLEGLSFATWDEFHVYLDNYARESHQSYISRDSKLTARYNTEQVKRKVKNFTPVPADFKHARVRYDCKHSHSNMSKNKSLLRETEGSLVDDGLFSDSSSGKRKLRDGSFYSACPVKMHVQVHKNAATHGEWRVLVTTHMNVHNHEIHDEMSTGTPRDTLPQRTLPAKLDAVKRHEALDELLSFFTSYQAAREDNDAFHKRYAELHTYIGQVVSDDQHVEGDPMLVLFKKLPKPPARKEKRPKYSPATFEIL